MIVKNDTFAGMSNSIRNFITLEDVGMAYKKVKADLFYSSRACRRDLLEFESDLQVRLDEILDALRKGDSTFLLGEHNSWSFVPKKMCCGDKEDCEPKQSFNFICSDPQRKWNHIKADYDGSIKAVFRLMEKLPVGFHVFATLWINKIGHKFDEKLTKVAYGNRLRRKRDERPNPLALGSMEPYLYAYCKWRDNAFHAMNQALNEGKSIISLTADVCSFYHELDAGFMVKDEFLGKINVPLNSEEVTFHQFFISALTTWADRTPIKRGIPVGLVASSIIANAALFELDSTLQTKIIPLYYGRYVDDIILVLENTAELNDAESVWNWLIERSDQVLRRVDSESGQAIEYSQGYLSGSDIKFDGEKNKIFLLSGASGKSVLASIQQEVNARTSEWRSLPTLPTSEIQLESMLLSSIQRDGMSADNLRKAEVVSVRRANFALKLRDIESYSRALHPNNWVTQRHAFLDAFIRHVLILPTFFDFFTYLPRVISLAVSCADFKHLKRMIDALKIILTELDSCTIEIKGARASADDANEHDASDLILQEIKNSFELVIQESIETSFPLALTKKEADFFYKSFPVNHHGIGYEQFGIDKLKVLIKKVRAYIKHDLAYKPLKQYLLPTEIAGRDYFSIRRKDNSSYLNTHQIGTILDNSILDGCQIVAKLVRLPQDDFLPAGLVFPTRPFNLQDLYLLHSDPFSREGREEIRKAIIALRGFSLKNCLPKKDKQPDAPIEISWKQDLKRKLRIGTTSWKTRDESWRASACKMSDPDVTRFERMNSLLNRVLRCRKTPEYLILPELSVPASWFPWMARKLQAKGINLICGVEYLHSKRRYVHNQLWAALATDVLGFRTMTFYRQDKQQSAVHEELELKRLSDKVLVPQLKTWNAPPVLDHGGFLFACLICSELTNIAYRASLRGRIDALFVPEWNKDTETFDSLVESAALDIHTYVIQCNDREYGDSRIRSPYKDSWKRDVVRVKGGIEDYFVTGEIDIQCLREFQSSHLSGEKPFKPVPDGFKLSPLRRTLPS